jgi:hypothetical protein
VADGFELGGLKNEKREITTWMTDDGFVGLVEAIAIADSAAAGAGQGSPDGGHR